MKASTNQKVSVVIPCFNQAKYLPETVQSVLDSTHPDLEILIVNDGSTDETEKVAKNLAEKYPNVRYLFQENAGPSKARNHGIRESAGDYILPLDGDDLISKDYIHEAFKILRDQKDVKVIYCEAEKFGDKNETWTLKPFSLDLLARDNMIFVSGIYRKSDWEACGGYDENFIWGREDWEFWISMLKNGGKVVKLPFVGFYYRITPNSRRKKMNSERKKKLINYLNQKHKNFLHERLNGPLRYQRTTSKPYNSILKIFGKIPS